MQTQKHIHSFNDLIRETKNGHNLALKSEVSSLARPSAQELLKPPASIKPLRDDFSRKAC